MASEYYYRIILLITFHIVSIQSMNNTTELNIIDLIKSSPYIGILSQIKNKNPSIMCVKDVRRILDGIQNRELWALKMYDASGHPQNGFIFGQNFWYGSKQACDNINRNLPSPLSNMSGRMSNWDLFNSTSPFRSNYVIIYANYSTKNQFPFISYIKIPIELAICVPYSCSIKDIFSSSQIYFEKQYSNLQEIFNVTIDVIEVKTMSWSNFLHRYDVWIIIGGLLSVLIFELIINLIPATEKTTFFSVKNCFSFKINLKNLMLINVPNNLIRSLDGLRTITCFFIIGAHIIFFSFFVLNNHADIALAFFDFRIQIFLLSVFYVDAFFVISAFLLVYNFLKNEQQSQQIQKNGLIENGILFLKIFLNRYIRLTPAIAMTIAFSHVVAILMKENSPYFIEENMDLYCPNNNWWRNLLYIQGYFPVEDMCGTWTWYLSADMQYFIICLIGLFLYTKSSLLAKLSFVFLSIGSVGLTWFIHYKEQITFQIDVMMDKKDIIYSPPWVRMNPYFGGILAGYFLNKWNHSEHKIKLTVKFAWITTSVIMIILLIMALQFQQKIPTELWQIEQSFGRYFLGCFLGFTILICQFGGGGIFGKFISHKIFFHLNKLTYMIYLINPIIITLLQGLQDKDSHFEFSRFTADFIASAVFCYILAIPLHLIYEAPFSNLSAQFLTKKRKIKTENI